MENKDNENKQFFKEEAENTNTVSDMDLLRAKSNAEKAEEAKIKNGEDSAYTMLIVGILLSLFCCNIAGLIVLLIGYTKRIKGSKECLIAFIVLAILSVVEIFLAWYFDLYDYFK